jgi:hypothetical protein
MRLYAHQFLAWTFSAVLSAGAASGLRGPLIEGVEQLGTIDGSQFFVASSGSDGNPGTLTAPWQTLSNVNSHTFGARDCVNFNGGDTFGRGTVGISSTTLHCARSYGSGQATISSGAVSCVTAVDIAPLTLSGNVGCRGSGATTNRADGILIVNDTVAQLGPVEVGWSVNGYGNAGIEIYAANAFGFSSVTITGAVANVGGNSPGMGVGVVTLSNSKTATASFGTVTVSSSVSNVIGTAGSFSGSGIFVSGAKNVVIDGGASGAVVHDNGALNATSDGPAGILVALVGSGGTCHITRYEVYNQKTANADGEGIDADWSTQNCIIERNFVHDNQGACLFAYNFQNSIVRWDNNQFRSNTCRNNGHGLQFGAAGAALAHCYFYGNNVYEEVNDANAINELIASANADCRFFGNVFNFVASSGDNYVAVPVPSSIVLTGNIYIGTAGYVWSGTHYATFAAWQDATDQEKIGGLSVGFAAGAPACTAASIWRCPTTEPKFVISP